MRNFNKIIFAVFFFLLCLGVKSNSEIVNKVEVKGNERISAETILIFGDIIIGKNYESSDINKIIKKLYESTFFSNISIELDSGKLSILVTENPIVNSIIFKGEAAKKYREAISEMLILRENKHFTR